MFSNWAPEPTVFPQSRLNFIPIEARCGKYVFPFAAAVNSPPEGDLASKRLSLSRSKQVNDDGFPFN
jgi:hypothetical protein